MPSTTFVFLPPAQLCHFPAVTDSSWSHSERQFVTTQCHVGLPKQPGRKRRRFNNESTSSNTTSQEEESFVPDSVDPTLCPSRNDDDEESSLSSELDSLPIRRSLPHSVIENAPEKLDIASTTRNVHALKRVRIRSPVLVIETPDRARPASLIQQHPSEQSQRRSQHQGEETSPSSVGDDDAGDADKSRVVLGEFSDDEEDHDPPARTEQHLIWPAVPTADQLASQHPEERPVSDNSLQSRAQPPTTEHTEHPPCDSRSISRSEVCKFSLFQRSRSRPLQRTALEQQRSNTSLASCAAISVQPPIIDEAAHDGPVAQSSAVVGPLAQATRQSEGDAGGLWNRRHLPVSADAQSASLQPGTSDPESASISGATSLGMQSILPPPTLHFSLSRVTPLSRILANPSHYVEAQRHDEYTKGFGGISNKVNLLVVVKEVGEVNRVRVKYPVDLPSAPGGRDHQYLKPGVITARGEVNKGISAAFAAAIRQEDAGADTSRQGTRPSHDGKTERVELVVMDGRTTKIKRLRPSSRKTGEVDSIPPSSLELVEEEVAAEKYLFKVVLWGNLAYRWTTDSVQDSTNVWQDTRNATMSGGYDASSLLAPRATNQGARYDDSGSLLGNGSEASNTNGHGEAMEDASLFGPRSTDPTTLRAGDVIFLENVSLANQPTVAALDSTQQQFGKSAMTRSRARLGAGFPPRYSRGLAGREKQGHAGQAQAPTINLLAHGSERNGTSIELCYRSMVEDEARDGMRNFDVDIANFDPKSRRVLELSRVWASSYGLMYQ